MINLGCKLLFPVSVQLDSSRQPDLNEKNLMMEKIEQKDTLAAGVLSLFSRSYPFKDSDTNMRDIVGIVALLGTVQSKDLSRQATYSPPVIFYRLLLPVRSGTYLFVCL